MRPREIAPTTNWIVLVVSLCFIYAIFGWIGVALMGAVVAVVVSLLIILGRRT